MPIKQMREKKKGRTREGKGPVIENPRSIGGGGKEKEKGAPSLHPYPQGGSIPEKGKRVKAEGHDISVQQGRGGKRGKHSDLIC